MRKFLEGFKAFAFKGNVVDLSIGVMIGGAFNKIVSSLVNDLFMPLLSLLIGRFNLGGAFFALDGQHYPSAEAASSQGVAVLNYGSFLATVIDFLCMALVIYLMVRVAQRFLPKPLTPAPKPEPRRCPYCVEEIHVDATRCPHCTATLTNAPQPVPPASSLAPEGQ